MQKLYILFFFLLPFTLTAQNIRGKVYDDESTVKGAKIQNITRKTSTYTDEKGDFKIEASVNDSIVFSSLFHLKKVMVLSKKEFEDVLVVELKKAINDLDEVLVVKEPDAKPFDPVEANQTLKNQILEDIKRNPHLYSKSPSGNFDIIAVAKLIGKLFKSKKPKDAIRSSATYAQLTLLFETDSYFTAEFLRKELKIAEGHKYLFLEFCEVQDIDSKLLRADNRFLLLDTFLKCSTDFREIISTIQKE